MSEKDGSAPAASASPPSRATRGAPKPKAKTKRSFFLAGLPLLAALLLYYAPTVVDEYYAYFGYGSVPMYELPPGVMDVFRVYDVNADGFIDPYEFIPLGMRLREQVRKKEEKDEEEREEGSGEGG